MEACRLEWDSEFFGFSVGRVTVSEAEVSSSDICAAVESLGCELVYVFLSVTDGLAPYSQSQRIGLAEIAGTHVDRRMVYRKTLNLHAQTEVVPVSVDRVCPALEDLAYISGRCSRFSKDRRLLPYFRPMYLRWLQKDLLEGKVFVYPDAEYPRGMVTASMKDGMGKIGLVAVDTQSRGQGIAAALLRMADVWFAEQGARQCEVVTQGENVAACRLYEKAGYHLDEQSEIWHVWRRH